MIFKKLKSKWNKIKSSGRRRKIFGSIMYNVTIKEACKNVDIQKDVNHLKKQLVNGNDRLNKIYG